MIGGTADFQKDQKDYVLMSKIINIASKAVPYMTSELCLLLFSKDMVPH